MLKTTVGQLLINQTLPDDLRDYERVIDKKGIASLLEQVAEQYPDKYREIVKDLSDAGRHAAFTTGGQSFGLDHLRQPAVARKMRLELGAKLRQIYSDPSLSDKQRREKILLLAGKTQEKLIDDVLAEARATGNPLARQLVGTGRGNKFQLNSLIGAPMIYLGHDGKPIPIPVLSSYSKGLTPVEYFAGTFGARKGLIDVKLATSDAGYFGKQLAQAAHRLLVTANDDNSEYDDENPRGYPVDTADADNSGSLLAHPIGGYARNTELTPKILNDLRARGHDKILVRSAIVGGPADGGVYSRDAGRRERGGLAPLGDFIGIAAAQAVAEPLAQAQICLAIGTLVRMADGTVRPIEDICVGDWVLGADTSGYTFPVRVIAVHDNGERECVRTVFRKVKTSHSIQLVSTGDHKLLAKIWDWPTPKTGRIEYGIFPVSYDCAGYSAKMPMKEEDIYAEYFRRRRQIPAGLVPTYDLEVDHPNHLFVLANGLIVSNSSKHTGGIAGATGGAAISGFKYINQLANVPKTFRGGASHAQHDGKVTRIVEAPQGGQYVYVGDKQHYVARDFGVTVKSGQEVEAGDVLSEGIPNPAEVVKYKGVGEGRRYFVDAFRKALDESGIGIQRRNLELLARGLINHVRLTEEVGDWGPEDVVPYQVLERNWQPRPGHTIAQPSASIGRYLERPVLHYSIGTRITPSVRRQLDLFGVKSVHAHAEEPPFQPEMIRAAASAEHDPDWMTRMLGGHQQKSLLHGVHRGAVSDESGTSYVPALAAGASFGRISPSGGWEV